MKVKLSVTAGPHAGQEFEFDGHDTFLVGRSKNAHFQLSYDDPYFSRRHFLVEINPPRCRVMDLNSRNGTHVNQVRIETAELKHGDEIRAGHTIFKVSVQQPDPDSQLTLQLPGSSGAMPALPNVPASPSGAVQATANALKKSSATVPALTNDRIELPGYLVEKELGRGAMGVVYRAYREQDRQPVAIKIITPAAGVLPKQVDRFVREAMILSDLSHPNIVRFFEVGEAKPHLFLAMELIEGPTADQVLKERGPMQMSVAVRLVCQLLAGLSHAHARGFVHRDIKPANILLGRSGEKRVVKLADFGLARVFESSRLSGLTMQGETGGTPAFMAPEQVTHYREVKPAADQYAAAATLYNLLTNQYVFDLPAVIPRALVMITTASPIPITQRRADIPAELAAVLHRALAREPEQRYGDVEAFRKALLPFG